MSADSSPLQELRQGAQALWDDLTRMETRFKGLAEETVASIQKQIDLLKERNSLTGGLSDEGYTFQPPQSRSHIIDPSTGRYTDGRTPGQSMRSVDSTIATKQLTVLDRILAQVLRIADSIESEIEMKQMGFYQLEEKIMEVAEEFLHLQLIQKVAEEFLKVDLKFLPVLVGL